MPRVLPQWDLSLVLILLTRAPFDPRQLAAPKFLAWKVFFHSLLASGARKGKLHATTARSIQHDNAMFPHLGFISKTQLRTKGAHSLQKLVVPALLPCLGHDMSEHCSLCPVWALKVYLDKTKDKLKDKELLFIS